MTGKRRLWALAVAAGCTVAAAQALAAAQPAAASTIPPGSVSVASTFSPFNPVNKTVRAKCPAGKRVLGGGGFISGTQHAVLTELRPISAAGGDSYEVSAANDPTGQAGTWALIAYAFCSSTAPGAQIVSATSTPSPGAFTGISATCPGTKRLVGAGGRLNGGAGHVDLLTLPEGGVAPDRTTAAGQVNPSGFTGTWSVTSYAVCVTANNLFDIQIARTTAVGDGATGQSATATCPVGMQATGGGGWADTPAHVEFIEPNSGIQPTSIKVGATAATGFTGDVIATALCAR